MKGKTVAFLKSKDFKGLFIHIFRKHIVHSLFLNLYSFLVPPVIRYLSPAGRDTQLNGLLEKFDPSDITDHLPTLLTEVVKFNPSLVLELGTRGGDSTKVLLKAASMTGAKMISVDIDDCEEALSDYQFRNLWYFVQADDVAFAGEFKNWSAKNDFSASVDVLFIDTSHEYEHTRNEIQAWFPHLSEKCKIIFHDTNMHNYAKRKNGSIIIGWDNQRGVIRAIEELLGRSYDEKMPFIDYYRGWLIEHKSYSNGLTILTRLSHD